MSRRLFLAQSWALLAGCGSGSADDAPYAQAPVEQVAAPQWLAPDHPALAYSDYAEVAITRDMARFSRPILDNNGYWHTGPGARVRFWTDGETVTVGLRRNYLMPREDTRQPVGVVLVDGVVAATWADLERVTVTHAGPRMRLHEVVMPYNDSVDFLGVEIPAKATAAAAPRTSRRIAVLGDSIAQGFWASDVAHSWPFLLAQATGCEVVNLAYGEAMCAPSDAVAAAALAPDVVVLDHAPGSEWAWHVVEEEKVERSAEAMRRLGVRAERLFLGEQRFTDHAELLAKVSVQGPLAVARAERFRGAGEIVIPFGYEVALL